MIVEHKIYVLKAEKSIKNCNANCPNNYINIIITQDQKNLLDIIGDINETYGCRTYEINGNTYKLLTYKLA